jgi:hypothetical protein
MISTQNETQLHRTLKLRYAERTGGEIEKELEGKICDVVTPRGEVIEIQTANVSKLAAKVALLIDAHPVTIIFPFAEQKIICKINEHNGETAAEKKSPKKLSVYSIFREITGLYPYLFHPNFTLMAIPCVIKEIRVVTDSPVQSLNNSRRHLKNWYKKDKKLLSNKEPYIFKRRQDYLALLPFEHGREFTARDLRLTDAKNDAPWMLWVFRKCGLVKITRRKYRTFIYTREM